MDSQYIHQSLAILKRHGYSITKPRRLVLELLDKSTAPLSAYEIKDALDATGEAVDTVSVYRIIRCLEACHLVHKVMASGKILKCRLDDEDSCHLPQANHCHHLLICDGCGKTHEVHCPESLNITHELRDHPEFKILSHNLEFIGLCAACQKKDR